MIVTRDIHELFKCKNHDAVQVRQSLPKFEWASLMLFDNEQCTGLTPDYIENNTPQTFEWANSVGNIPETWNFCVDYEQKPSLTPALIHYTAGIPYFLEQRNCDYADVWWDEFNHMTSSCSWVELMGQSVHVEKTLKRLKSVNTNYLEK